MKKRNQKKNIKIDEDKENSPIHKLSKKKNKRKHPLLKKILRILLIIFILLVVIGGRNICSHFV